MSITQLYLLVFIIDNLLEEKRAFPPKSICLNIPAYIIHKRLSDLAEINSLFSRAIVSKLDYMEM